MPNFYSRTDYRKQECTRYTALICICPCSLEKVFKLLVKWTDLIHAGKTYKLRRHKLLSLHTRFQRCRFSTAITIRHYILYCIVIVVISRCGSCGKVLYSETAKINNSFWPLLKTIKMIAISHIVFYNVKHFINFFKWV